MSSSWNSVEIATLIVGALTPLTVAFVGLVVARTGRRLEAVQWTNQTVVSHRLNVFREVAPMLNQLLCFGTFVGKWKDITTVNIMSIKRQVDEIMYSNRLLFSDELFAAYREFMTIMFSMYVTKDADALVRAPIHSVWGDRQRQVWWDASMAKLFDTDKPSSPDRIQSAYEELVRRFRADLYITNLGMPILADASS
jgi:hypothetical protein